MNKLTRYPRRLLWALALLVLLGGVLLLPGVHWCVVGWWKGEAFYQGRSTSYWSREVHKYHQLTFEGRVAIANQPPSWLDQLKDRQGVDNPRECDLPAVVAFGPKANPAAMAFCASVSQPVCSRSGTDMAH